MRRVRWLVGGMVLIALAAGVLWLRGGGPRWAFKVWPPELGSGWRLADQGRELLSVRETGYDSKGRPLFTNPVAVHDTRTGQRLRTIWGDGRAFVAMESSPHGPWVACVLERDGKVALHWANIRTGETRSSPLPDDAGREILFSPEGDLAFVAIPLMDEMGYLLAIHLPSGMEVGRLRRRGRRADDRAEERFGGRWLFLLEGNAPARVSIWDCLAHKQVGGFHVARDKYPATDEEIEVRADGRMLAAIRPSEEALGNADVQVWRIDDPAWPALERTTDDPEDPAASRETRSPCWRWLAVRGFDADGFGISIIDTAAGGISKIRLPEGDDHTGRHFTADGRLWVDQMVDPSPPSGWWTWLPTFLRGTPHPTPRICAHDPPDARVVFRLDRPSESCTMLPLPDGSGVILIEPGEGGEVLSRYDAIQPPVWPSVVALLLCLAGAVMLAVSAWPRRKAA